MTTTHRDIVFAQSALTYLRTKLRDVGRLDAPERQALDWLEDAVGARARTLAEDPAAVVPEPVTGEAAALRRRLRDAASAMVTHPRDWSTDSRDAWLYGVIVGWDEPALKEIAGLHRWSEKTVDKLRECRSADEREPTAEPAQPEAEPKILLAVREDGTPLVAAFRDVPASAPSDPLCLCSGEGACLWCRLKDERAAHAAEVERLRGELAKATDWTQHRCPTCKGLTPDFCSDGFHTPRKRARSWLPEYEAERVAHEATKAELAAARAERPEPTDIELATALWEAGHGVKWGTPPPPDAPWMWAPIDFLPEARAAKAALLGVRREGPTPTDERPWNYEAPPDSEIGQLHELLPNDRYSPSTEPRLMTYSGQDEREVLWTGTLVRPGQKPEDWTRVFGVSVKAWRRAEPKGQPEPAADDLVGMPTPWRERIERLEVSADDTARRIFGRLDALERAVEGLK